MKCGLLRLFLVLAACGLLLAGSVLALERLASRHVVEGPPPLELEEVKTLMKYHGARIARQEGGRWYFLGANGRWLPLETSGACRYLASLASQPADDVCLF